MDDWSVKCTDQSVYELLSNVPSTYNHVIYYYFFSLDISPVLPTKSDNR